MAFDGIIALKRDTRFLRNPGSRSHVVIATARAKSDQSPVPDKLPGVDISLAAGVGE